MFKSIKIENFRCFDELEISDFSKINLISGKNNAGKTALLEALFLNSSPRPDTVSLLRLVRREQSSFSKAIPERTWNNFFFQQNKTGKILIEAQLENGASKLIEIFVDESIEELEDIYDPDNEDAERGRIANLFSGSESVVSVLHIKATIEHGEVFETLMIASAKGLIGKDIKVPDTKNASFIPSFLRISSRDLTTEFDKARLNERDHEVLKAFQSIDPSIVEVESFSIGEPTVYLRKEGGSRLPLSLFGDAINRIANIVLKLVNNENSILLIDEIENGIHHSSQVYFWNILYKLAHELNVQVFATTHSLEMTQAFIQAGQEYENSAAHFELTRHIKTGKVVAIRRDLDTLGYGIRHNKEVRGG